MSYANELNHTIDVVTAKVFEQNGDRNDYFTFQKMFDDYCDIATKMTEEIGFFKNFHSAFRIPYDTFQKEYDGSKDLKTWFKEFVTRKHFAVGKWFGNRIIIRNPNI